MSVNEISATIEIQNNSDTEISYNTNENPDLESTLNVTEYDDLSASIDVRASTALESSIDIVANGMSDLSGSLVPNALDEATLSATIDVAATQTMDTEVTYNAAEAPDLEASIEVQISSMIPAKIDVPVTFTERIEANKDTFVDRLRDTFNYGDDENLFVGREDRYRTLIGFDIEGLLSESAVIRSAKLKLTAIEPNDLDIEIQRLLSDWDEHSTTWLNTPETAFETIEQFNTAGENVERRLEIDLTKLVKKWREGELENHGILLKAISEKYTLQDFYAREYEYLKERPALEIEYYDPNILAYNDSSEIVGTIGIPEYSNLESSLEVDPLTDPDLESTIEVHEFDEFEGIISVANDGITEITGSITSNKVVMAGILDVPYRNDLDSTISIRNDEIDEFEASLSISKPDMPGYFELTIHNNINGSITVKAPATDDLDSKLAINKPEIPAELTIPYRNNLNGTIMVRQSESDNLETTVGINRPDMPGEIQLKINNNLDGTITVRQTKESDINSTITSNKPEMPGHIIVPYRNNINGIITIRQSDRSDIDSNIGVNRPEIPATIELVIASSFDATITVRRDDENELSCSIGVAKWDHDDIRARMIPRIPDISEILSTIKVVYASAIPGVINVKEISEIVCEVSIDSDVMYGNSDLPGYIHIRWCIPRHWKPNNLPDLPRYWYRKSNRHIRGDI